MPYRLTGFALLLLLAAAALFLAPAPRAAAGEDVPTWLRQAAAASAPAYDKDVPAVVVNDESTITVGEDGRTLVYERNFFFGKGGPNALLFPTTSYPSLKAYFDQVNKADGHTIVLKQGAATATTSGSTSN